MDVCLPADFQIADEESPMRLRYVDDGPSSYEDGYWLGAEAFVALPTLPAAKSARRDRAGDDPTWRVL
jgi:hypothetical protein